MNADGGNTKSAGRLIGQWVGVVVSIGLLVWVVGAGRGDAQARATVAKLGHLQSPANHQQAAAVRFAKLVSEKTNGRVEVRVFPAAQLGNGRDMLEAVRQGNLELTLFGADLLEPVVPVMGATALPYVWGRARAKELLSGQLGKDLGDQFLAKTGARILAWGDMGEQAILTRQKDIHSPADLKGLKIRVPEVPSTVHAFQLWGANPTVITFAEVYNALQAGVVDGAVMPPDQMVTSRLYEVAKHLSLTNHLYLPLTLIGSEKFFRAQPADIQKALLESAHEAISIYDRDLYTQAAMQAVDEMKKHGVTVTQQPDRAAFERMVPPVWKRFGERVPEADAVITTIRGGK